MKKILSLVLIVTGIGLLPLFAQENPANPKPEEKPALKTAAGANYNPEGRRDPFKDLLGGGEVRDKSTPVAAQLSVDDLILIGIVKTSSGFTAIVGTTQGFPHFMKVGETVSDGYIVSITQSQVVFRKTSERGVPLMRPRDITKEINPEER
jgi:Tfp pilus assembly protein PilP